MKTSSFKVGTTANIPPQVWEVSEAYLTDLDCPRSLSILIMMRYGEWEQVASQRAIPNDYATAASYHRAALASDWLRKYPGLPLKSNPVLAAGKSWVQSERECRVSNRYLKIVKRTSPGELSLLLDVAREFCLSVLGPVPLDLSPRFGPGATMSDPARATTVLDKVNSRLTLTQDAACLLPLWKDTAWEKSHFESEQHKKGTFTPEVVRGNKYFLVPKDALTHRACAKGPSLNVSYQLAVGQDIRKSMSRVLAYDLAAGQDHHRNLARRASLDDSLATVDSSRASDTQCLELIRILTEGSLWSELLESLREPETYLKGRWVKLAKFSAMGNGYTFELETLVFLSLAYAIAWASGEDADLLVRSGEISVYGDDVLIPSKLYNDFAWVLNQVGFTVNRKKSYESGPFRESCGGDFYDGQAVNTAKLDCEPSSPADWFSIHNKVLERFIRSPLHAHKGKSRVLHVIKDQLPRDYRSMYGPTFLGDRVLHGWFGPQVRTSARKVNIRSRIYGPWPKDSREPEDPNQWIGKIKALAPRIQYADIDAFRPEAQLAYILYGMSSEAPARRPTRTLRFDVVDFEGCYYTLFEDNGANRPPRWMVNSPYSRFFGIGLDGKFVS